jgi:uncharacterized membrane protein
MSHVFWKRLLVTLVVFLAIDGVWLGVIAREFYATQLGELLRPQMQWQAAAGVYLLLVLGLVEFVVTPGLRAGSLGRATARGALFGLVAYATYDLTNLATLVDWPLTMVLVDLAWGTTLCALVTLVSVGVLRLLPAGQPRRR